LPDVIVLGFGMAVTVAPLTTVVMNSVNQERVGAASGVNNAVARVAGVLAIAVLGIVMVNAFSLRLNRSLAQLSLSPSVLQSLHTDAIKLAGMRPPEGLDAGTASAIQRSIAEAFVFGFRTVMWICAGLALAASGIAQRTIPRNADQS
jgi:hypothetical protein